MAPPRDSHLTAYSTDTSSTGNFSRGTSWASTGTIRHANSANTDESTSHQIQSSNSNNSMDSSGNGDDDDDDEEEKDKGLRPMSESSPAAKGEDGVPTETKVE